MKEEKSKIKQMVPWLVIIPVVALLLTGASYLSLRANAPSEEVEIQPFTTEIADESYIMEYSKNLGNWGAGYFRLYRGVIMPDISFHYTWPQDSKEGGLTSSEIQEFYQTLDLSESNIGEICIWKDYDCVPNSLLFYGADRQEGVLMVTRTGEIFVKGYRYLGNKKEFIEKLNDFAHNLQKDWMLEEDKVFLEEFVEQIEW